MNGSCNGWIREILRFSQHRLLAVFSWALVSTPWTGEPWTRVSLPNKCPEAVVAYVSLIVNPHASRALEHKCSPWRLQLVCQQGTSSKQSSSWPMPSTRLHRLYYLRIVDNKEDCWACLWVVSHQPVTVEIRFDLRPVEVQFVVSIEFSSRITK